MKRQRHAPARTRPRSHPARGAWIETLLIQFSIYYIWSHPARGAWIETKPIEVKTEDEAVAPREGCVD